MPNPGDFSSKTRHHSSDSNSKVVKLPVKNPYMEQGIDRNIPSGNRANALSSTNPHSHTEKVIHKSEYKNSRPSNYTQNVNPQTIHNKFHVPFPPPSQPSASNFSSSYPIESNGNYTSCNCMDCCSNRSSRNECGFNPQTNPIPYPNYNSSQFYENVYRNSSMPSLADNDRFRPQYRPQMDSNSSNRPPLIYSSNYRDHEYQQPSYFPVNNYPYNKIDPNIYDKKIISPYYNTPDYYQTSPFYPIPPQSNRLVFPEQRVYDKDDYFSNSKSFLHLNENFSTSMANNPPDTQTDYNSKIDLSNDSEQSHTNLADCEDTSTNIAPDKSLYNFQNQPPTIVPNSSKMPDVDNQTFPRHNSPNEDIKPTIEPDNSYQFNESLNGDLKNSHPFNYTLDSAHVNPKKFQFIKRDEVNYITKMEVFVNHLKNYATHLNKESEMIVENVNCVISNIKADSNICFVEDVHELVTKHSRVCTENSVQLEEVCRLVDNFTKGSQYFNDINKISTMSKVVTNGV